ncbi:MULTISPECIES: MarR family winged helix-turn-helix transcriptional regulator [unclassified Bacillus (in: firmicutes)]|uniref:MarR family winged helix-turn-helix transcriptional regulator n=1 Tax=unclassified Bacillus (in: firmicutes) TaxID=185979 RepID=UPI000BF012CF|nr:MULTISPECIES: MarR family transcriptional regulator [unclassified Bacillus (in: firmicutes)]PEJ57563.1 MarR family transcriptional regulator [Bacillus sp. AFS002410]PEK99588.1 MarR family transcriptional regulator [Bacillus sp. AFS017336]
MTNSKTHQIAEKFIQLLPLVFNKFNKPGSKNSLKNKQSELTHLQSHILEELFQTPDGISLTELAQNISISKQQMTPLIMKLEEKEYVSKIQDANDKRSVKIVLTEKGKKVVSKRWEDFYHIFIERVGQLDEEDLLDLDYSMHKIIRILGKIE